MVTPAFTASSRNRAVASLSKQNWPMARDAPDADGRAELSGYDEPGLVRNADQLRPVVYAELHQRPRHVRLNRRGAEMQMGRDLHVAQTLRHERHDLTLARRQVLESHGSSRARTLVSSGAVMTEASNRRESASGSPS